MSELSNSETIDKLLNTLIEKIARRTSERFATVAVRTMLIKAESKYDFLKHIEIGNTLYSEGVDPVSVTSDIDAVEYDEFYDAIVEIIRLIVSHLERDADFFFIKEFQDAISNIGNLKLEIEKLGLSKMQYEYIVDRKLLLGISKSELMERILGTLTGLLSKNFSDEQAVKTIISLIKKLEGEYNFLEYVEMGNIQDSEGCYSVKVRPEFNDILSSRIVSVVEKLIKETGETLKSEGNSFMKDFKNELGREYLSKIEDMGLHLDNVQITTSRIELSDLTEKTLKALLTIVTTRTSKKFAFSTIVDVLKVLEEKHDVLKYIKIDESEHSNGIDAVNIMPEINSVKPYELSKAIRDTIKMTGAHVEDRKETFIGDFKKQLGANYIQEIEKIGVNLHFLELKFL